ncbi:MAG TPA: ChbG/HpnK family deacetylase [Candidatus Tectomicrobia bacterium]|nr:ChbG/HpnK family deacetylase [Candidatus Tectomicrobia bacterium]
MASGNAITQLIVTADDFNLSEGVSRGILEAHHHGIVTETSVMVNLGDLQRAAAMLASMPQLGVGLHLNITRGRPVAQPRAVAELLGPDGQFLGAPQALPAQLWNSVVRAEFQAQVDSFVRTFGRLPQHLDTHHHVHQHPVVLEVLLDLAASLQLPARSLDLRMRAAMTARGVGSPERFLGDAGDEPYWTVTRLLSIVQGLQPGVTELMCHPGYFDDAIAYSRYGRQREVERLALCAPEIIGALREKGIQLVTYAAVP